MTDLELYSLVTDSISALWPSYSPSISLYEKMDAVNDLFIKLKRYPKSQSPIGALGAAKCLLLNLVRDSKKRQLTDPSEVYESLYGSEYVPLYASDVRQFFASCSPAKLSFWYRYVKKYPSNMSEDIESLILSIYNERHS